MSAPPPPYELFEQSAAAAQRFDRMQNAIEANNEDTSSVLMETERLRNFISYCLAADYQAYLDSPCSYTLSSADCHHYIDVYNAHSAMRKTRRPGVGDDRVLAPYLRKHLHEPCASLGIPVGCVELVVIRFAYSTNRSGRYEGCTRTVRRVAGMRVLAKKLWTDRQLLIPRLGMTEETRLKFNEALLWMARLYFVSIDGSDSTTSVLAGLDTNPVETTKFKYTLSPTGQKYKDNPNYLRSPRERVLGCLLYGFVRLTRMKPRPRSRLPIFPERSLEDITHPASAGVSTTQAAPFDEEPCEIQAPAPRELSWVDFDSTAAWQA